MQDELVGNAESMSNGIRIHRMPLCVRYLCRWTPLGVPVLEMRGVVDEEGWKLSVVVFPLRVLIFQHWAAGCDEVGRGIYGEVCVARGGEDCLH
jgi:hypothetical protein